MSCPTCTSLMGETAPGLSHCLVCGTLAYAAGNGPRVLVPLLAAALHDPAAREAVLRLKLVLDLATRTPAE